MKLWMLWVLGGGWLPLFAAETEPAAELWFRALETDIRQGEQLGPLTPRGGVQSLAETRVGGIGVALVREASGRLRLAAADRELADLLAAGRREAAGKRVADAVAPALAEAAAQRRLAAACRAAGWPEVWRGVERFGPLVLEAFAFRDIRRRDGLGWMLVAVLRPERTAPEPAAAEPEAESFCAALLHSALADSAELLKTGDGSAMTHVAPGGLRLAVGFRQGRIRWRADDEALAALLRDGKGAAARAYLEAGVRRALAEFEREDGRRRRYRAAGWPELYRESGKFGGLIFEISMFRDLRGGRDAAPVAVATLRRDPAATGRVPRPLR